MYPKRRLPFLVAITPPPARPGEPPVPLSGLDVLSDGRLRNPHQPSDANEPDAALTDQHPGEALATRLPGAESLGGIGDGEQVVGGDRCRGHQFPPRIEPS
jgi:hypothetical protein